MYRPLDGRIARILGLDPVERGQTREVLELDLEAGQVGGSVAQADERLWKRRARRPWPWSNAGLVYRL
jgi:hypothetical protein